MKSARLCETTLAVVAVLLPLAGQTLAQCPPSFTANGPWPMSTNPYTVGSGDFNHDGRMDLVAAGFGGSISMRLANPNAPDTYNAATTLSVALNLRGLGVADFNHDGWLDFAAGSNGAAPPPGTNMAIMLANPGGSFGTPTMYPTNGGQPYDVRIRDLNNDGNPDIITSAATSIVVYLGNSNGTFQPAVTAVASVDPAGFTLADVNGDGTLDIVSTRYADPPQVRVSLGVPGSNGTGYAAFVPYTVPAAFGPWGISTGDFNGDGRDDVVVTHRITNRVGVLIGNTDGSLTPMATAQPGVQPQDVAVADFNGDGNLDVAVGNWGGNNLSVLIGDGTGLLGSRVNYAMGTHPNSVAVADMNNDGRPDILVANQDSGGISVLLNTTAMTAFSPQPLSRRVCPGGMSSALFVANATTTQAGGITSFRWERLTGGVWQQLTAGPLAGVGTISFAGGTNGDPTNLFVSNVQGNPGDTVMTLRAVAVTACGGNPSSAVTLSIIQPCGGADIGSTGGVYTGCGDGVLDNNDFVVFIDKFFAGDSVADVGRTGGLPGADGHFDNNDFVVFIDMFFGGCTI